MTDRPTHLSFGKFRMAITISATGHPIHFMFGSRVGFSGSNGAISGWTEYNKNIGENNA